MTNQRPLRVASYNTRDFLDDAQAAARVVRAITPDILCLQEVPRRLGAKTKVTRFARDCGMRWIGRHRGSGGTTIFVGEGVRVDHARHVRLPVALLDRTRGYALAHVAVPGWPPLTVASVHLSLRPRERERHAQAILGGLRAPTVPVIVAGDLNEGESGPAHQRFLGDLRRVSSDAPTYPVRRPRSVLDVIFASSSLSLAEGAPVDLPEDDVQAGSDHRPIWVDLLPA